MENVLINEWIASGCNYKSGVKLAEKLCKDDFILRLLQSGETSFTKNKLKETLLAFKGSPEKENARSFITNATSKDFSNFSPKQVKSPFIIDELSVKAKNLYKESNTLRLQLLHEPSQTKRRDMAFKILENMDTVFDCYEVVDKYKATGELPAEKSNKQPTNLREIIQREANLLTYITKYKQLVTKTTNAKLLKKYTDKLNGFELELVEVRNAIDLLDKKLSN